MAAAFSPLMTAVLLRVPVSDAADATGVIVTVNQLALVTGVATFGTLYLNLAGQLPTRGAHDSFTLISAHAVAVSCLALAAASVAGGLLALARAAGARRRTVQQASPAGELETWWWRRCQPGAAGCPFRHHHHAGPGWSGRLGSWDGHE